MKILKRMTLVQNPAKFVWEVDNNRDREEINSLIIKEEGGLDNLEENVLGKVEEIVSQEIQYKEYCENLAKKINELPLKENSRDSKLHII